MVVLLLLLLTLRHTRYCVMQVRTFLPLFLLLRLLLLTSST